MATHCWPIWSSVPQACAQRWNFERQWHQWQRWRADRCAALTDDLPTDARHSNILPLDLVADASVSRIIKLFGLTPRLVHLVLVNGTYIQPDARLTYLLHEGDVITIWPPIVRG